MWVGQAYLSWEALAGPSALVLLCPQHSFDVILQWAIQSMSRPLAEVPTFPS